MSNPLLSAFNNLVIKFNDDLIITFPEENDFKVYKRGIILLNSANSKKICLLFKDYMKFYRQKIIEKDESFFLNNNYIDIVNKVQSDGLESIITKLKNYWNNMSSGNKDKIWEYLNSLIKLSELIK
tara:strand:+ start:242 stop:619 length:378 start_codon:yes stop_codon:yes gene_type:complete